MKDRTYETTSRNRAQYRWREAYRYLNKLDREVELPSPCRLQSSVSTKPSISALSPRELYLEHTTLSGLTATYYDHHDASFPGLFFYPLASYRGMSNNTQCQSGGAHASRKDTLGVRCDTSLSKAQNPPPLHKRVAVGTNGPFLGYSPEQRVRLSTQLRDKTTGTRSLDQLLEWMMGALAHEGRFIASTITWFMWLSRRMQSSSSTVNFSSKRRM
ncbi:hypothetical protein GJ744_003340 [Endocarpon pusillum]|uniref:Uncharacterized protein n=1 Tax=Endocarpon pusillum TaxID=364733 RepID=A0A8H7A6U9_9EURO|nr:hypothetical protein GJ744_003340 [Endocarpon pusillum]